MTKNKIILLIIVLMFLIKISSVTAANVTVCSSGCNHTTIQDAIYNVSNGDIINVINDSFTENVTVNVSVFLNGTNWPEVVGGFNVSVDNVTIKGFNITEGIGLSQTSPNAEYRVGILLKSNSNSISNNYFYYITGNNGTVGPSDYNTGGKGGLGAAIYINSSNNNITDNTITNISGGLGNTGGYDGSGGTGGKSVGIYLDSSANNNIINNTISLVNGSKGGTGNFRGTGGDGGLGVGIYLSNSLNNNLSLNNITEISGGDGGSPGVQASGSFGNKQFGFGVYLESDSYNNEIDLTNTLNNDKIFYYYNKTGVKIKDNILVKNSSPTNLGKIVLINSSSFTIKNNKIANFTGESGESGDHWTIGSVGSDGAIASGIYSINLSNSNITNNEIIQIKGGKGGTGGFPGSDTYAGNGGKAYGIYLEFSVNNNITNNTISQIEGGTGGTGGRTSLYTAYAGTGGLGSGIYLTNSSNNNITYNNITNINLGQAGAAGQSGSIGTNGTSAAIYLTAGSNNTITTNWLYNNSNYTIYNNQELNITLELNYFNTSNSTVIDNLIYDYYEDSSLGIVDFNPWYLDITFTISSDQAPVITINKPINNYNISNETIVFNATISSNQTIANVSLYTNFTGSFVLNETNSSGDNNVEYFFNKTLNDGSYKWAIEACDTDGNCTMAANRTLNLDTTAPTVSILSPVAGSTIATADVITTASYSDFNNVSCEARIDAGSWQNMLGDGKNSGTANYTFTSQADGSHTINVNCTDTANITHYTNQTVTFTVSAVADNTKPVVNITAPLSNAYLASSNVITNVNFSDASNTNCEARIDAGSWQNMAGDGATAGTATHTFNSIEDGNHTINVNCTDTSSNNATANVSFNVDTVNPVINLESPLNNTVWSSSSTVTFNYNVSDEAIANCSLIVNSVVSSTDFTVTINTSQSISS